VVFVAEKEELLTVDEAAARLKVQPDTVRRWLRSGKLRASKLGRDWRIPASSVEGLLKPV
jgi:excisionase family DNA binding protein